MKLSLLAELKCHHLDMYNLDLAHQKIGSQLDFYNNNCQVSIPFSFINQIYWTHVISLFSTLQTWNLWNLLTSPRIWFYCVPIDNFRSLLWAIWMIYFNYQNIQLSAKTLDKLHKTTIIQINYSPHNTSCIHLIFPTLPNPHNFFHFTLQNI